MRREGFVPFCASLLLAGFSSGTYVQLKILGKLDWGWWAALSPVCVTIALVLWMVIKGKR